ncbi:MAG: type II toxin-antitoxin system HicA family toxin [Nitrospirae bacterium]|nr:type II toxin-antitoxin system HicA family toxin [Nitrospirota bacterium]
MPKLPALTPDDVIKILLQNGFEFDHQRGSHRVYYNGQTKRRITVPYHKRDLPKGTLLSILKQAGLRDLFQG